MIREFANTILAGLSLEVSCGLKDGPVVEEVGMRWVVSLVSTEDTQKMLS